jgi:hypothetical protein
MKCVGDLCLLCEATETDVSILLYMDAVTEFKNTCGTDMTCGEWFIGYVL